MASKVSKRPLVRPERGPGAAPIHLHNVDVRGVRMFDRLRLQLPMALSADEGQWIVVLGENGAGKTTLLRCLCSVLFGADRVPSHGRLAEGHRTIVAGPSTGPYDGYAYGSLRGTALGGAERDVPLAETSGLETLFRPNERLVHAETWLRREALRAQSGERAGEFFKAVLTTVASLLPGGERLLVEGDQILLESPTGQRCPLSAMSDGYLTTLGWTIDLIARWAHRYRDSGKLDGNFAKDMPCVVLVDEIDLHLHPRWQLDIIPRLRKAFPKTTFIVTTHNPLTLHGTRPGEVFVLQRDDAGKVTIAQRDVPLGLDADRLLTGDWFGLSSTLDESTLQKLDQHREMLLAGSSESDPKRKQLEAELRGRLNGFADTSAERLAHGVVAELLDEKLRNRRDITDADRQRVIAEVRARLAAVDGPATGAREGAKPYEPRSSATTPKRKAPAKKAKVRAKRA